MESKEKISPEMELVIPRETYNNLPDFYKKLTQLLVREKKARIVDEPVVRKG
jgi:hypothetical protein